MAWRAWLPDEAPRPMRSAALGAVLGAAAMLARLALSGPLGASLPFITFFPALILAAALGGYPGGLACLAVSAIGVAVLLPPIETGLASAAWAFGSFLLAGGLVVAVASALSDSVRALRGSQARLAATEARLKTLVSELAHRNRNALFVITAIVSQSSRSAVTPAEAEHLINARLQALMRAQDVVLQSDGTMGGLGRLVELAIEPFDRTRFEVAPGPDVQVEGDVAVSLGLLFHELATNAVKYGALSHPAGRIRIGWTDEAASARLTWKETGGPPVQAPTRVGFGARLFGVALTPQGGRVERRFDADGLFCELTIPKPAPDPPDGRLALLGRAFADRYADEPPRPAATRTAEPEPQFE